MSFKCGELRIVLKKGDAFFCVFFEKAGIVSEGVIYRKRFA